METQSIAGSFLFKYLMKDLKELRVLSKSYHVGQMWHELPPWILEQIFTYVKYNTDLPSGNNELARIARVCKHWSPSSLNLLWAQCNDLTHLLRTLPSHILRSSRENGVLVSCDLSSLSPITLTTLLKEFTREMGVDDLERFTFYSHRIQQLTYHHQLPGTLYRLDTSILQQLHTCLGTCFPNLQRLFFASGNTEGWMTLSHFASTRLSHLILDFRLDFRSGLARERIQQHVSAVHDACEKFWHIVKGSLRTLVTKINRENEAVLAPVFTEMTQHLSRVRKLQVPIGGPSLPSSFHQLCQLKDLVVLDIKVHMGSFDEVERLEKSLPPNPFKSLRTLHLESTIAFYQPVIRSIQSTTLNSLRLVFREQCPLPTESFNTLIQATCCATSSLQVFDLTIHTPCSRRLQSNLPTAAVLLPLFAHRRLQELVIDLGVPILLTDADIDTIACMWPKLWRLRLTAAGGETDGSGFIGNDGWQPQATFRAVMALLYHLRSLTELAIEFDAATLDDFEKSAVGFGERSLETPGTNDKCMKNRALRTSVLKTFDVGQSKPGQPLNVACWLAILCPNLRELRWTGESEGWEKTSTVLQGIQGRATV